MLLRVLLIAAATLAAAFPGHAARKTVCTITVNSDDEKETFRKRLPPGQYDFVELVGKGRAEWLQQSCQKRVQCDVLVVSGHFNAGDDFYSDRLENHEYLRVDELERASCSGSCPALFSQLKEVYLFGCESLDGDATRNASHGESSRERMRRIFSNVPVIYGFSGSAPVGPTAAMLLNRYFDSGPSEIATGRVSQRLLRIFGRNSITHTRGDGAEPAKAAYRAQMCQLFDDRLTPARKLAAIHRMMAGDKADARAFVDRIEKLLGSLTEADRATPEFRAALADIGRDTRTGEHVIATARSTGDAPMRVRLIALAAKLGWLTPDEQQAEHGRMITDLLARNAMGFAEVDLVCAIGHDGALEDQVSRVAAAPSRASGASRAAALACMGSAPAHAEAVRALTSSDVREVQVAQAYLRHRPVTDPAELRTIAEAVTRMAPSEAQVRAFDTLARLRVSDREVLEELTQAFAQAKTAGVQRAIAEVFIRSGARSPGLASVIRRHRIRTGPGDDLIDELIRRLQSAT